MGFGGGGGVVRGWGGVVEGGEEEVVRVELVVGIVGVSNDVDVEFLIEFVVGFNVIVEKVVFGGVELDYGGFFVKLV